MSKNSLPHLCVSVNAQGFSATVNAILENVPARRQTMLFSATQTKSVKDLARLSLHDPTYIAVHREAVAPTPLKLQQVLFCPCSPSALLGSHAALLSEGFAWTAIHDAAGLFERSAS